MFKQKEKLQTPLDNRLASHSTDFLAADFFYNKQPKNDSVMCIMLSSWKTQTEKKAGESTGARAKKKKKNCTEKKRKQVGSRTLRSL